MSTNFRNEVYLRDFPAETKYKLLSIDNATDRTKRMLDIIKELTESKNITKPTEDNKN